jgi:hypothetical protein
MFNPRIAILDTGAPVAHPMFAQRSKIRSFDCRTQPCVECVGTNCSSTQFVDQCNHGTWTAAIVAAYHESPTTAPPDYRGVTPFEIGTYRTYDVFSAGCGSVEAAGVRALQQVVADGYHIALVEHQETSGQAGAISLQADNAFDTGLAVIATNGNQLRDANGNLINPYVRAPAIAHKVLGVGGYVYDSCVSSYLLHCTTIFDQALGPAPDGRIKPDVQAPSETRPNSQNQTFRFGGTSGAAPYAAGAAALWGWLINPGWATGQWQLEPGHLYARLLAGGTRTHWDSVYNPPRVINNEAGVGPIRMTQHQSSDPRWGVVTLTGGQYVDIQIPIPNNNVKKVKTAIWWPETHNGGHNDIDLFLLDQAGTSVGGSRWIDWVFERMDATKSNG